MFEMEHLICSSLLVTLILNTVSARFCEGGSHKCNPPKECCAQGCCYLYSPPSVPKTAQPSDHVLNLFFINHWYFWLFVFAIVIALLLLCSLWKKRHSLFCSGSSSHRSPSELDSAGSCYAPPHYSRCSSFYHAPPPYSEVTSKPDMYPLVFSYTNDGSKNGGNNGSNYLMVQYFRNYIVRPIGSLSATSTQDSLSSSFICTTNEANTMIPPPYSSAASPDGLSMSLQNYAIPRSASQQAFMNNLNNVMVENHCGNSAMNRPRSVPNTEQNPVTVESHCRPASENFVSLFHAEEENASSRHHIGTSSSTMATTNTTGTGSSRSHFQNTVSDDDDDDEEFQPAISGLNLSTNSANAIDYNDDNQMSNIYHSTDTMLSLSAAMMDTISYSRKTNDHTKLSLIQRQLEKCCEMIQQQQKQIQQTRSQFNITGVGSFDSESPSEIEKRAGLSFLTSRTGSTVSSLANLNSHGSQPQVGDSPTQEVKELLEQIRQLQDSCEFTSDKIDEEEEGAAAIMTNDNRIHRTNNYNDLEPQPGPSNESHAPVKSSLKRPTSFNSKRRFFNSVINRSVYSPIASNNVFASPSGLQGGSKLLKSPTTAAGVFMMKSRCIKNRAGWISKSAPTTPGTCLPSSLLNDNSPLLNEQDEDAENETENDQNC